MVVTEAEIPSLEEVLNIKADLKRSREEFKSRSIKTSDDLIEEIEKNKLDFETTRDGYIIRFNAAQAYRLLMYENDKAQKVSECERVQVNEKIPGSPEGSERRLRSKLFAEISKLVSQDAENDRKTHKALFSGTHESDWVLDYSK